MHTRMKYLYPNPNTRSAYKPVGGQSNADAASAFCRMPNITTVMIALTPDDAISAKINLTAEEGSGEDNEPAMPVKVVVTEMEFNRLKLLAQSRRKRHPKRLAMPIAQGKALRGAAAASAAGVDFVAVPGEFAFLVTKEGGWFLWLYH